MKVMLLKWLSLVAGLAICFYPAYFRAAGALADDAQPNSTPIKTMPTRYRGPLPELSDEQKLLRDELRRDVEALAGKIGERNLRHYEELVKAARYIEESFAAPGLQVVRQTYPVGGRACDNLETEIRVPGPRANEIVVIGAHYDSVRGSPGANDNGSGVAALLALARRFAERPVGRTLRFVAFVNEEPPYFQTREMGSRVYARRCRQRKENIVAAVSLETIGYYSDAKGSQRYPPLLSAAYPSTGNFIGFVGNVTSRPLVDEVTGAFRRHAQFPSEKGAMPAALPGVGWSDHWSFWQEGYPGVMVTDTAKYRYPHYHLASDTPDKVDYDRLARVVDGLAGVVGELVQGNPP